MEGTIQVFSFDFLREFHEKTNLSFHSVNATVSFYQKRWWVWDQEASGIFNQDDTLCILNIVPIVRILIENKVILASQFPSKCKTEK